MCAKCGFSLGELIGWIVKLLSWRRWRKRAIDAEDQNRLDDETHGAETDIHDAADRVTRPPHGPDDDLLGVADILAAGCCCGSVVQNFQMLQIERERKNAEWLELMAGDLKRLREKHGLPGDGAGDLLAAAKMLEGYRGTVAPRLHFKEDEAGGPP